MASEDAAWCPGPRGPARPPRASEPFCCSSREHAPSSSRRENQATRPTQHASFFFKKISIMPHLCTVETEGQQFMGKQDVVLRVHARAQLTGRRGGGVGRGYENEYVCV